MKNSNLSAGTEQPRLWSREFVTIIAINLGTFMGFQMLLPTLPVLAKHLGGSDSAAGLVVGIFAISALLARPISGHAVDRFGRKVMLLGGLILFTASVFAYHWAVTLGMLFLTRFVHGLGWGISSTASSTTATDVIPKSRMGEGMGYFSLAGTASMALAPAAGLWVMSQYGFNALFNTAAALVLAAVIMAVFLRYPQVPLSGKKQGALFEKPALAPAIVIFFLTMSYGAIVSFIALYAKELGIDNIGPFFTVYAVALFFTRPFAGKAADKWGYDTMVIPGICCMAGAMMMLGISDSMTGFLMAAVLYGLGFGAVAPCLQTLAVIFSPPERRGSANGTYFTGFDLGIGLSSVLWGFVAQAVGYSSMYMWTLAPVTMGLLLYLKYRPQQMGRKNK